MDLRTFESRLLAAAVVVFALSLMTPPAATAQQQAVDERDTEETATARSGSSPAMLLVYHSLDSRFGLAGHHGPVQNYGSLGIRGDTPRFVAALETPGIFVILDLIGCLSALIFDVDGACPPVYGLLNPHLDGASGLGWGYLAPGAVVDGRLTWWSRNELVVDAGLRAMAFHQFPYTPRESVETVFSSWGGGPSLGVRYRGEKAISTTSLSVGNQWPTSVERRGIWDSGEPPTPLDEDIQAAGNFNPFATLRTRLDWRIAEHWTLFAGAELTFQRAHLRLRCLEYSETEENNLFGTSTTYECERRVDRHEIDWLALGLLQVGASVMNTDR